MKKEIRKIKKLLMSLLSRPAEPDRESLSFLESSFGIEGEVEFLNFLGDSGRNDGTIYDLIFYPSDSLRDSLERYIPPSGISDDETSVLVQDLSEGIVNLQISAGNRKFTIPEEESCRIIRKFLTRLNPVLDLGYIRPSPAENSRAARSVLRKINPQLREDHKQIVADFTEMWKGRDIARFRELLSVLIKTAGQTKKDIMNELEKSLAAYEDALEENRTFQELLSRYSMEIIIMQKIQPPLITYDRAHSMITDLHEIISTLRRRSIRPNLMLD